MSAYSSNKSLEMSAQLLGAVEYTEFMFEEG